MRKWMSLAVVCLLAAACSTAVKRPEITSGPVSPGNGEMVAVKQAILIVDSSSSMKTEKIRMAKMLTESIVDLMPEGDYQVGMIAFGDGSASVYGLTPFQRADLAAQAKKIPYIGGNTPLELSLEQTYSMLSAASGRTAVIVISDGRPTYTDAAMESAKKVASHPSGEVCIHTVLVGEDAKGQAFLDKLAALTSCGSFRTGDSLLSEEALRAFVRTVFIGAKPVVAVEKPEPPKPKDSDGDGVTDDKDQCPDTPKGAKVDERGCWVIPGVTFELDKAVVRPLFYPLLDDVANVIKQNSGMRVYIDGHTCSLGTNEHNQKLSEQRAVAVREYLIGKGIDEASLVSRGFGETKPAFPNTNETSMSKNRRVELSVIK